MLIGSAVITETVFGLPGIGFAAVRAINQQDLPVVVGVVIVASAAVIVANLIVDICYAVLDPHVRLHKRLGRPELSATSQVDRLRTGREDGA